jgi:HK97 family phage prohead protease
MRFYWPIAKFDAERRMVWGYASTEAEDEQGETVRREALAAALEDYMRFANIREMHQPSAVGVAEEAAVDDKGLYLAARIVDSDAWEKVAAGVYKGFSIGGRVTARDPSDRNIITGLSLTEISVVDRPANPEAVFDCWKRAAAPAHEGTEYADPGYQEDGRERYSPSGPTGGEGRSEVVDIGSAGFQPARGQDPGGPIDRLRAALAELCEVLDSLCGGEGEYAAMAGRRTGDVLAKREPPLADALAKLEAALLPRLDALHERVEQIARTPLPPQAVARGFASLSKREDAGLPPAGPDDIVAALARMSEEERTLTLIKAARANPITPSGRRLP